MLSSVILLKFSETKLFSRNLAKLGYFELKNGPPEGSKSGPKVVPAGIPRNPDMVQNIRISLCFSKKHKLMA